MVKKVTVGLEVIREQRYVLASFSQTLQTAQELRPLRPLRK